MIQRIQSVYLLLAGIAALLLILLPLGSLAPEGEETVPVLIKAANHLGLLVSSGVMVSVALATIFLYTNRPLQARIGNVAIVSALAFTGIFLVVFQTDLDRFQVAIGTFMPVIYIILVVLGIRSIRRDEALVKSADRFR